LALAVALLSGTEVPVATVDQGIPEGELPVRLVGITYCAFTFNTPNKAITHSVMIFFIFYFILFYFVLLIKLCFSKAPKVHPLIKTNCKIVEI
jgi:uncharacterized membrane protein